MPRYAPKSFLRGLLGRIGRAEESVRAETHGFLATPAPSKRERERRARVVAGILRELKEEIPEEARYVVQASYDRAERAGRRQSKRSERLAAEQPLSAIHRETIALLSDNLIGELRASADRLGRNSEDVFRRYGLQEALVRASVIPGRERPREIHASRMRERLAQQGQTAFVDRAGRRWKLSTYSAMVVRTTTSEAQNRAIVNVMTGRDLDLVEIDKHEHENDVCSPYDGKTFSLTGRTPGYPVLTEFPPFHPNCEHFMSVSPLNYEILVPA